MKKKELIIVSLICLLVTISLFLGLYNYMKTVNPQEINIYEKNKKFVVELKASSAGIGESYGSAVFIKENGILITNAHVISYKKLGEKFVFDDIFIRFLFKEDYVPVQIVKYDYDLDLAVLTLENISLSYGMVDIFSGRIANGDEIYAMGNLNNTGISLTKGIISNTNIIIKNGDVERKMIQCDIVIAEGNSGGALFNKNGELIGLTTLRLKDSENNVIYGISYCIPIDVILKYIN